MAGRICRIKITCGFEIAAFILIIQISDGGCGEAEGPVLFSLNLYF